MGWLLIFVSNITVSWVQQVSLEFFVRLLFVRSILQLVGLGMVQDHSKEEVAEVRHP